MSDDVVSETLKHKALLHHAGEPMDGPEAEGLDQGALPAGLYKIVSDPGPDTHVGWRIVRVLTSSERVLDRCDAIGETPKDPHHHESSSAMPYPLEYQQENFGPQVKRNTNVVTLWRTSHVVSTRFLMVLDEASALAKKEAEIERLRSGYTSEQDTRRTATAKRAAAEKQSAEDTKTIAKLNAEIEQHTKAEAKQIDHARKMERELGKLRADKEKLVRAVGGIRAKDILDS